MGFWNYILNYFKRDTTTTNETTETQAAVVSPRTGGSWDDLDLLLPYGGQTSLAVATAYRCVQLLSESVANLPLRYMRLKDGIFEDDYSSHLHYLLNVQPDSYINAFDFWRKVVQNVLLDGNAYIVPIYSSATMDVDRLALCGRGTVSHDVYNDTYDVCDVKNGIYGHYEENEIIHIKGQIASDEKVGVSVLTYARLTLDIALTGDKETRNRFANGGNVRGLVSNDTSVRGFGEYQDEQLEKTAENLDERFQGGERIVSLPGQVDFKQISLNSTDMQFLESRKFTVREICRFFGVHPSFVFDDTSNNYKSAEMANVAFLSNTLNPLLRKIECELLRKLVAPSRYGKRTVQFDRRGLYACDLESRIKYQAQTIAAGLYTVNEWRKEENKAPVEGGDKPLVSANLKGIDEPARPITQEPKPKEDKDDETKE
jgi:HK97 family phage portal protein